MIPVRRIAWLMAAILPMTASATPVTYDFSGSIDFASATVTDSGDYLTPIFPFGTTFSGSFTYDDAALPQTPLPGYDLYLNSIMAGNVSFGSDGSLGTFALGPSYPFGDTRTSNITVLDGPATGLNYSDELDVVMSLAPQVGDPAYLYRHMGINGISFDADVIGPGQNISDPLPFDEFQQQGYLAFSFGFEQYDADGNSINQKSVGAQAQDFQISRVSVPEPATMPLWIVALLGLGAMRRRTRQGD